MPTKFHHHLQAWIHSTLATPPLPLTLEVLHIMGSTQNTLQGASKSPLDDLMPSLAPTAYPILLHPFVHGLDLLDAHSSLLVHLVVVLRARKQAPVSVTFYGPTSSYPFVTLSRPGIICYPNYSKALQNLHPTLTPTQIQRTPITAHHPSQQVSQNKIQANFIFQLSLFNEDQQTMFQAKMSPQRHLHAL